MREKRGAQNSTRPGEGPGEESKEKWFFQRNGKKTGRKGPFLFPTVKGAKKGFGEDPEGGKA